MAEIADHRRTFEVAVIGAGQAGLAIGYFLARQGRRFVILDAADAYRCGVARSVGLTRPVHTAPLRQPAGLAFPGDPDGYPTRDEVVAYLEQLRGAFELPVQLDSPSARSRRTATRSSSSLTAEQIKADQVVVATGPFQTPRVPASPSQLAPEVFQTHSIDYRRPSDSRTARSWSLAG